MASLAEQYRPEAVEKGARSLWAMRGLPRPDGILGRGSAPILRQFEGAYVPGDDPTLVTFRAVGADVAARYLTLSGRRASGTLRRDPDIVDDAVGPVLRALSVWVGGEGGQPYDGGERRDRIEAILGRMAARGLIVTRDAPLRICPHCAAPRSPERIVYAQEEGDTYLVRFPVVEDGRRIQALVWVDAPWRLLGATALLLNPEMPYVVARYRRKDVDDLILTSRSSLARLVEWLPGAEVEVLEEHLGSHWSGRPYEYPLRAEFPMGGELTPPGGTLQAVPDVGDSGTGIVPLVPGHGGTDAQIAERVGVTGWPLVTTRGQLATTLMHKYAGLDLATASEFVLRDLGDSGVVFAHLRVRRGVPYCAICGTSLVWAPGRAWCLEPSRLPPERRAAYLRLLPRDPPMSQIEVAAWPVSDSTTQPPGPGNATLLECPQCERVGPLGSDPACSCGGTLRPVTRPLLPSIRGILGAWARSDPFPAGDAVWIYLNERRRAPALTHHLAVMTGVIGAPADVGLTILPGVSGPPIAGLIATHGADAVRCALVLAEGAQQSGSRLDARCAQEAHFLSQYWQATHDILGRIDAPLLTAFLPSITGFVAELEVEDRAVLARWERVRVAVLADFDGQTCAAAYRRLSRFLSNDLPRYRTLVAARLEPTAPVASRRAALRTLHHLVRGSSLLLAPVAPHTAELVYGATQTSGTSLFEASLEPVNASLMDEERARAWDRWQTVLEALSRFRKSFGIPPSTNLPGVVVVVGIEDAAQSLRNDRATLERLARVERFEAFGPATPWTGRRRDLEPVLSEIQKVYPSEATQIVHLLRRQPAHRRDGGAASGELSVVLQGTPRRILPSMVTYAERLPDRVLPASWRLGEMYVELPAAHPSPARVPPPLSPDAFALVERVQREIRQRFVETKGGARPPLVVATLDPLATELKRVALPLAAYLGVSEVRVIDDVREFPLSETSRGRTKTGVRWWLHLPGLPPRRERIKHHLARPVGSRVRPAQPASDDGQKKLDYASSEYIAREEQVRALMAELDGVLGAPLLGFAKTAGAWDAGLQSRAAFEAASFDTLAALPGFGWPVAEALVVKFGGIPPPRPTWGPSRRTDLSPPEAEPGAIVAEADATDSAHVGAGVAPLESSHGAGASVPERWPGPPASYRPPAHPVPPTPVTEPALAPTPEVPLASETTVPPLEPLPIAHTAHEPPPTPVPETQEEPESPTPLALPPPLAPPVEEIPQGESLTGGVGVAEEPGPATPPAPAEASSPDGETEPLISSSGPPLEAPPFGADVIEPELQPIAPGPGVPEPIESPSPVPPAPPPPEVVEEGPVPAPLELDSPERESPEPVLTEAPPFAVGEEGTESPEDGRSSSEILPGEADSAAAVDINPPLGGAVPTVPAEEPFDGPGPAEVPVPEPTEGLAGPPEPPPGSSPPELSPESPALGGAPDQPASPARGEPSQVTQAVSIPLLGPPVVPAPQPGLIEPPLTLPPVSPAAGPAPPAPTAPPASPAMVPPSPPVPPPMVVVPWGVQVIVSPSYLPPLREFLDMTAAGHRGVAIVRESPERLRTHIGPRPAEVYWLTNLGRGLTVKPNDLAAYGLFLETAVERDRVTAFFLEGIEYLVRLHGIDRMVELLTKFHAQAVTHEARVWVCVHPNLIAPPDLDRLVGAFTPT